ncbi:MAG: hypothetical protein MUF01_02220 [Bryobacterales bacterium]|nr:hypothetical protein [Bryobacterales bacterium]
MSSDPAPGAPTALVRSTPGGGHRWVALLLVGLLLALLAAAATWWAHLQGYTLYYGDAQAHVNIARRVLDSQTPEARQIGTVWLPLPHLLTMVLVGDDELWASGLAGAIPASICFWMGGMLFLLGCRDLLGSTWAALAALALLALNPNLLYLQATPMTEPVFLMALAGIFFGCVRFVGNAHPGWALWVALFALAASMTRYDGWVLLPLLAAFLFWKGGQRRWANAFLFCIVAGAGPLWWLAHNWWYWGDALEFYRGPYSAKAIYQRQLAAGMEAYPGDGSYWESGRYYLTAAGWVAGWPLFVVGSLGLLWMLRSGPRWAALLMGFPALFYIQSMQNAGTPIFVPNLWPFAYYNTRYGMALLPALCLGAAVLVKATHPRFRPLAVALLLAAGSLPWLLQPGVDRWIVWKEGAVNSQQRRQWLGEAASYLQRLHRPGEEILLSFGDPTGVLQLARIPLRESLHEGNHPRFRSTVQKPEYFLWSEWAVCQAGDDVSRAMHRAVSKGLHYAKVREIRAGNAAPLEIWRRRSAFEERDMSLPRNLLPPREPEEPDPDAEPNADF